MIKKCPSFQNDGNMANMLPVNGVIFTYMKSPYKNLPSAVTKTNQKTFQTICIVFGQYSHKIHV